MSWTDTQANCLCEICCGKDGKQVKAMAEVLRDDVGLPPMEAQKAATWLCLNRDFTPQKGTLYGAPAPVTPELLVNEARVNKRHADAIVVWLNATVDCAPKGSLYAFKQEVARLARGEAYE